ncbi:MAG: type I-E CRISPR-associated protein Cas6/Cse3/CasE [Candidatus Aureabacteria bacterium]|nr:type I-E CRISPR-associated protein Cas6/Cse3/CasE [Candidatus Auribacterota bacterium]
MYLHRIHLDLRCTDARRDVADPYEMHSTLCRAFSTPEAKCAPGAFLWRLEPELSSDGMPKIIVQSRKIPEWSRINLPEWFGEQPSPPLDLAQKLAFNDIKNGSQFRYRVRANPSVRRNGKRIGLFDATTQIAWFQQQGKKNGFKPLSIHRSEERMLTGKIRSGNPIRVFSVLYDGILEVTNTQLFNKVVSSGIGHAKAMGLGLLSVIPIK